MAKAAAAVRKLVRSASTGRGDGNRQPACRADAGIVGQHIALDLVPFVLTRHVRIARSGAYSSSSLPPPAKPLSLFFAGAPGVGKTLFETRLRQHLFTDADADGLGSGVVVINGGDYSDPNRKYELRRALVRAVAEQVLRCPLSMVVLNEVRLVAPGVLEALTHVLGRQQPVRMEDFGGTSIDFRRAVFVFTSNAAGDTIAALTDGLLRYKTSRSELDYDDYREVLREELAAVSPWITFKGLIDYYVPFLPMRAAQVREFAQRALEARNCSGVAHGDFAHLTWTPEVPLHLAGLVLAGETNSPFGLGSVEMELDVHVMARVSQEIRRTKFIPRHTAVHVSVLGGGSGGVRQQGSGDWEAREQDGDDIHNSVRAAKEAAAATLSIRLRPTHNPTSTPLPKQEL